MLGFTKNTLFRDGVNYNCSVVILYQSKSHDGNITRMNSTLFDVDLPQAAKASKKRNTLVWAIPVALVVIVLVIGLLLMAYKYRRLQNSFLAFAARGGYSRQMDDYADDDDDNNMGVAFHAGTVLHLTQFRLYFCFSDDTTPYSCGTDIPTVISELQDISTKVFNWFGNNHMKANPGKCHLLLSTKSPEVVSIDGIQITSSTSETLLGITTDSELNFENHLSAKCNKVSRKINALGRSANYMPIENAVL